MFGGCGQEVAGYCTSRPIYDALPAQGTGAESDTVLYRVGTAPDSVRALPSVHLWAEMAGGLTHLPVAVEVQLRPPPPRAAAVVAAAADGDSGGDGIGRKVPQVESAVYRDAAGWDAMATRLEGCFGALLHQQAAARRG